MVHSKSRSCWIWLLICFSVSLVGCGQADPSDAMLKEQNNSNILRLANLYFDFQTKHANEGYRGPSDIKEFKSHIKQIQSEKLAKLGISDIEKLLLSERDSELFEIKFGVAGSARGSREPVIFEKTGKSGKKMVGFLDSRAVEMDASEADKLLKGSS